MVNEEFEKILEKNIKNFNEVPKSVDEKIQKAYKKIKEKEMETKKTYKFKFSKLASIAASFVMVAFLAGNGVAYAKGEDNIYSWILQKIGIQKEYEEIKTEINQTVESNGVKITLLDAGYDDNFLVCGYKIEADNLYERICEEGCYNDDKENVKKSIVKELDLAYMIKISNGNEEKYFNRNVDTSMIEDGENEVAESIKGLRNVSIISDNEIIIYTINDISKFKTNSNTNIELMIYGAYLEIPEIGPTILRGEWDFNLNNIKTDENYFKEYLINKTAIFNTEKEEVPETSKLEINVEKVKFTVEKAQISKIGTILKVKSNLKIGIIGDLGVLLPCYSFDIVDNNGNIILEEMPIPDCDANGEVFDDTNTFFMKRLNLDENYTVRIYKYYRDQIYADKKTESKLITTMDFNIKEN